MHFLGEEIEQLLTVSEFHKKSPNNHKSREEANSLLSVLNFHVV